MAKVELRKPIIEEISELLEGAATAVVVDYRGLTVAQDTDLRRQLREAGVIYKVYKNTMINFAIKGTDFEDLAQHLAGPAARVLYQFAKNAEALEVKGGIVDGVYYDEAGLKKISNIPSREVLLSKLLGSIQSPITNFARVIKQIAEKDEEAA